jgi:hypothetical protein
MMANIQKMKTGNVSKHAQNAVSIATDILFASSDGSAAPVCDNSVNTRCIARPEAKIPLIGISSNKPKLIHLSLHHSFYLPCKKSRSCAVLLSVVDGG